MCALQVRAWQIVLRTEGDFGEVLSEVAEGAPTTMRLLKQPAQEKSIEALSLRNRAMALRNIPPFVSMVWRTHAQLTILMVVLRLGRALTPVLLLWNGKVIIDALALVITQGAGTSSLWRAVALEMILVVGGEVLSRASALVESLLADLFTNRVSVLLMKHCATVDLCQFEDPTFQDQLERARGQMGARIGLLTQLLSIGQSAVTLSSLAVALFFYSPVLLTLLAIAVLPGFFGETHFNSLQYSLLYRRTPARRQLDYLRQLGSSERTAKELQVFGLSQWLIDSYRRLATQFYEENKRLSIRKSVAGAALSAVGTLGYYIAYVFILAQAGSGRLTIGAVIFLATSFMRSRDLMTALLTTVGDLQQQGLHLKDFMDVFSVSPQIVSKPYARKVPATIRDGIRFENVGFRYPDSDKWAVRHVSFHLRPGERVALVGENGAGKTTLTKLLARLYDPTEGRILLDGVDLRDYDLDSLRQTVGVIFQDFIRYDLPLDVNIGVGEIGAVRNYFEETYGTKLRESSLAASAAPASVRGLPVPERISMAAEKSLAASLLPGLPDGYRQMLGRRFEGGIDLSGGEWQKIALARAYMRDAHVLILDEPTAALDARAEYEVFARFSQLMEGRMALVISHRFSTVRASDRIVVLQGGTVAAEGTHEELVERGGLYAELFALQAEGYR